MPVEFPSDPDPDDIPELTPHDRLRAVAAIFATGLFRLQTAAIAAAEPHSDESDKPTAVIEKVP